MLVIDASTAVDLCLAPDGFGPLAEEDLVAPPLILSETLSALHEMRWRDELPEESSPKLIHKRGYTPSKDDVKRLLNAQGTPRARLLAHWMFYAPSRLQTFSDARWPDLDLEQGTWTLSVRAIR